jgi:hypothetical protein
MRGSPPKDNINVNIMNLISVVSLFVVMVWLIDDATDSLIGDTTVSASVTVIDRKKSYDTLYI